MLLLFYIQYTSRRKQYDGVHGSQTMCDIPTDFWLYYGRIKIFGCIFDDDFYA